MMLSSVYVSRIYYRRERNEMLKLETLFILVIMVNILCYTSLAPDF